MRRAFFAALLVGVALVAVAPAAGATDITPSCGGVLSGADSGLLTKSATSVVDNNDGTWTITYRVDSTRGAGVDRFRDCVFIDEGSDNAYGGETLVGSTDEHDATFIDDGSGGSYYVFDVTVDANANDTVCDRAARSGDDGITSYTDKSNVLCTPLTETVIPEAPFAVLLPLSAAALLGGFLLIRRRRALAVG
jgi:hypothetical protein